MKSIITTLSLLLIVGCSTTPTSSSRKPTPKKTTKSSKTKYNKPPVKYKQAAISQTQPPKPTALSPVGATAPHDLSAVDIKRNHFILLKSFPQKISAIEKRFNEKAKIIEKQIPNHHSQSIDYVITLNFSGAVVEVYKNNTDNNSETVLKMIQTKPKDLGLNLTVGMTRADVESYLELNTHNEPSFELCELQEMTPSGPLHSSACVKFNFKQDIITEIDWIIPFD